MLLVDWLLLVSSGARRKFNEIYVLSAYEFDFLFRHFFFFFGSYVSSAFPFLCHVMGLICSQFCEAVYFFCNDISSTFC